jgi:RNA polymerase sigma factor (sigma-70 family)
MVMKFDYVLLDEFVTKIVQSLCTAYTIQEDIEDIKQDVLLSLLERYGGSLLDIANEHPEYIYVHTRSRVIDYFRAASRSPLLIDLDEEHDLLEADNDVEEEVLQLQLLDMVNSLPTNELNLLADYFGLDSRPTKTLQEIAEEEGVSPEAIWQRKSRLLDKLRANMHE